jgi:hypothetical protein
MNEHKICLLRRAGIARQLTEGSLDVSSGRPRRRTGGFPMGVGVSVFLIAAGAILAFAVDISTRGIDLSVVGVILMIVGVLGLLADFVIFGQSGPFSRRTTVLTQRPPVVDPAPGVVEESYVDEVPYVAPDHAVTRRRVVRRRRDII